MSYLATPRLHFNGFFQADVSTINNDVRFYDSAKFKDQYQQPAGSGVDPNGAWNPEGTAVFRFVGCRVTGGRQDGRSLTDEPRDPVLGMALEASDDRVPGKLVDLDPQQQTVSEIWGMSLRLTDGEGKDVFRGDYAVAAFINLWRRQLHVSAPNDQTLAAVYQSVLEDVTWHDTRASPLLEALREASADGLLSINFNVYGFGRDPSSSRFSIGRLAGTIGPAAPDEPHHFVLGRQMVPDLSKPVEPLNEVGPFQCLVDGDRNTLTVDLGHALPIQDASGTLTDLGDLVLGVLNGGTIDDSAVVDADAARSDMGKVMGKVMGEVGQAADGRRVSAMVGGKLS